MSENWSHGHAPQSLEDAGWRVETRPDVPEASLTESHHRIPVAVAADGSAVQAVIATRPVSETRQLANLNPGQIGFYLSGQDLPKAIRDALTEIGERKAALDAQEDRLSEIRQAREGLEGKIAAAERNLAAFIDGLTL